MWQTALEIKKPGYEPHRQDQRYGQGYVARGKKKEIKFFHFRILSF